MTVAQTSLFAYRHLEKLGDKQAKVFGIIEDIQPCHNKQIARKLNWEINRVTGRVNELYKKGCIKVAYVGNNEAGNKVKYWEVA